jgi:hypothetical protein
MFETAFSKWSVPISYKQDNCSIMKYYPAGNVSAKAEEYPLLEDVTSKRLVETVTGTAVCVR